jgi:hypothetical protein
MPAPQMDLLLLFSIMIGPADSADEKNILTKSPKQVGLISSPVIVLDHDWARRQRRREKYLDQEPETGWPDFLLTFLVARK